MPAQKLDKVSHFAAITLPIHVAQYAQNIGKDIFILVI